MAPPVLPTTRQVEAIFKRPPKESKAVTIIDPATRPDLAEKHVPERKSSRPSSTLLTNSITAKALEPSTSPEPSTSGQTGQGQTGQGRQTSNALLSADRKPGPGPSSQRTETIARRAAQASLDASNQDEIERAYNVYAQSFVPESLQAISRHPGFNVSTTEARHKRSVDDYVACNQLPVRYLSSPPIDQDCGLVPAETRLDPDVYAKYFLALLGEEMTAQEAQNEAFALHSHRVRVEAGHSTSFCRFEVPGLSEDTPYLEEDDIVTLRHLRTERREGSTLKGCVIGPWDGQVYHGRVVGLHRPTERVRLFVRGLGLGHIDLFGARYVDGQELCEVTGTFTVTFPVSFERYTSMCQAVTVIQRALRCASSPTPLDVAQGTPSTYSDNHSWLLSMLFPTNADCDVQERLYGPSFSQPFLDIDLNWEQKKAVENICKQNYGTLPYLISGPPGSGKSRTLIETALQLLRNVKGMGHILMCAPSDPAADTLVARLSSYLTPHELFRLNRPTRTIAEVPVALRPFCYLTGDHYFHMPDFDTLMSFRIVVTSCRDASLLVRARMTNTDLHALESGLRRAIHPSAPMSDSPTYLHWTALLMDEAAQALEPEAIISLSVLTPPLGASRPVFTPLVVMAGDEQQLGPRTCLPKTALKRSLFARLFSRPVYADHALARGRRGEIAPGLDPKMLPILRPAFTNLVQTYRSHPAILAVPSNRFYFDTLESAAPRAEIDRLASWHGWRGRAWPVLFHANISRDDIHPDGGGWYNQGEATVACNYAASLVKSQLVQQHEVCIMSPFKSQVDLLRKTIRQPQFNLWDVNIGPTEAFQGLEKGVVILCTTRSKKEFLAEDIKRDLGIVGTKNKMNVALTRAKFGLIVVGNRDILACDDDWAAWVAFCDRNGLVAGTPTTEAVREGWGRVHDDGQQYGLTRFERQRDADRRANEQQHGTGRALGGHEPCDEMWARELSHDALDVLMNAAAAHDPGRDGSGEPGCCSDEGDSWLEQDDDAGGR